MPDPKVEHAKLLELLRGDDCALEDRDGLVALLAAADGFAFYEKVSKMITEVGFGEAQLHEALRRGVACKLHASVAKVDWVVGSAESVIDLLLYTPSRSTTSTRRWSRARTAARRRCRWWGTMGTSGR